MHFGKKERGLLFDFIETQEYKDIFKQNVLHRTLVLLYYSYQIAFKFTWVYMLLFPMEAILDLFSIPDIITEYISKHELLR